MSVKEKKREQTRAPSGKERKGVRIRLFSLRLDFSCWEKIVGTGGREGKGKRMPDEKGRRGLYISGGEENAALLRKEETSPERGKKEEWQKKFSDEECWRGVENFALSKEGPWRSATTGGKKEEGPARRDQRFRGRAGF